jgi:hypothetical protein
MACIKEWNDPCPYYHMKPNCPIKCQYYKPEYNHGEYNQCDNCIRKGLRDCMYHGYPKGIIPDSCAYKIGNAAIDTVYDVPTILKKNQQK